MGRRPLPERRSFSHYSLTVGTSGVLAIVSNGYPPLWGRSPTCYSPVRHSHLKNKFERIPFDLHALGTPLAFILSQDQTLRGKFSLCFSLEVFRLRFLLGIVGFELSLISTTLQLLRSIARISSLAYSRLLSRTSFFKLFSFYPPVIGRTLPPLCWQTSIIAIAWRVSRIMYTAKLYQFNYRL